MRSVERDEAFISALPCMASCVCIETVMTVWR